MGPLSPKPVPPVTAEYVSALESTSQGGPPRQTAYRFFRSADGKSRVDFGNTSVIHDPAAGKAIVLDHVKKEARVVPAAPAAAPASGIPQTPGLPAIPGVAPPTMHVQDLGKTFARGHEVEGRRYTIQPPPHAATPQPPITAEVWTNPQLGLPIASKVNGSFGQQIAICRSAVAGEPHPALFQIPQGYTQPLPKPPGR